MDLSLKMTKKLTNIIDKEVKNKEIIEKDNKELIIKQKQLISLLSLKDRQIINCKKSILSIINK